MSKKSIAILLTTALIIVAFSSVAWRYRPYQMHGTLIKATEPAANLMVPDHTGEMINMREFRGKVVLLYFGYMACPDVCPLTLVKVTQALDLMGRDADDVQLLFITVDPTRDTPERVGTYVDHFHPSFIGLIPESEEDVLRIATQYGIFYQKNDRDDGSYLMDHTATLTVIDTQGYMRAVIPYDTTPEELASDLSYIAGRVW